MLALFTFALCSIFGLLALLDLVRPHLGRSLVKLSWLAWSELKPAWRLLGWLCLLESPCVAWFDYLLTLFFFGLLAWLALRTLLVFLSLLCLAGQTALGSLARGARFACTDRTGASGLLRRLSLLDLLGFLLPPNFYGGPLRGPP